MISVIGEKHRTKAVVHYFYCDTNSGRNQKDIIMLRIFFAFILALLTISISNGQTFEKYVNYSNGFCSTSIQLNSDGTFNYESGCERSSYISFGTWIKKGDTIKFRKFDLTDFKILDITSSKTNKNSLTVKVFNQLGENITEKIKLGQIVKGKGIYDITLDSSKTIRTDLQRDSGIIVFKNFEKLLNKNSEIKVNNHNHFEITLNIPNDWIYKINSNWINIGDFELIKTKDSLTSITSDDFDEKGNAIKTVYQKY